MRFPGLTRFESGLLTNLRILLRHRQIAVRVAHGVGAISDRLWALGDAVEVAHGGEATA